MAELLKVPEVAAGTTEVVISQWLAKPGDQVKAGDAIAVIETEKAMVEVEAETDATLLRPLATEGAQVAVGSPMALLGTPEEAAGDVDALLADLGVSPAGVSPATARREVPDTAAEVPAPGPEPAPARTEPAVQGDGATGTEAAPGERRFISPIARKLLAEAGLEAATITGTGPSGRIQRRDVEAAIAAASERRGPQPPPVAATTDAAAKTEAAPARVPAEGAWTDVPHSRLRRAVATRLTQSKQLIPHFYVRRTVRLDDLLALRAQLNEAAPTKLSVNDFLIRAIAVAHTRVPEANVIWTEEAMRRYDTVDISVAIASERGLVTPVLRGVERSSLSAISSQVKQFVEQANGGRLQQKDLEGGSITLSNLGMYDVDEFTAIINPPQSAILAVGAGRPTVGVVDGQPAVVTTVNLVLSVDHRAIDGALAAQWMSALVQALENPLRLVV